MGLLDEILRGKREEISRRRREVPRASLEAEVRGLPPPRDLEAALVPRPPSPVRLIAELKRASPLKGVLALGFDPVALAPRYAAAGAAALSVLTDPAFSGELADLDRVRAAVDCPLLRKDFLLEEYQLWEARAHGADAVLLIAGILEPARLRALAQAAKGLGLAFLVEVHTRAELERALDLPARLIGINNRDLQSFQTRLETTETLAPLVPPGHLVVSESGIFTRGDVERVAAAGVRAVLVGEALSRSPDPVAKLRELAFLDA